MAKPSRLASAALIAGNGALMLCALGGLALSFVSLYPVDAGPFALLPQAVIFALAALAAWSLPRWSGRVCLGLAALWAFNLFLNWQDAAQGALLVFSRCLAFTAGRFGYVPLFQYDPPPGVSGEEISVTFLTLALALLALLLGLAVVRLKSWALTALLTLAPLAPALLSGATPHWAGFSALCACLCALALSALCRDPEGRGRLLLTAFAASAALLLGIGALFPREGYARPQWAQEAERAMVSFGDRFLEFLREWDGPFHDDSQPPPAGAVDLAGAGPVNFTGRPVLRVRASAAGHYYLRGSSLDVYTGSAWEPFPDEIWAEYTSALPEGAWTGSPLLFLGCVSPFPAYHASVQNVDRSSGSCFLPYQTVEQDWEELGASPARDQYFQPAEDAWGFNVTLTGYDRDLSALVGWPGTHEGALSPLSGPVAQAEDVYRDYVYGHYLDVPDSARGAVNGLLTSSLDDGMSGPLIAEDQDGRLIVYDPPTASSPTEDVLPLLPDFARLIRALLADRCAYDLSAPAAPEGTDFVTWFLNEGRQGYCMHFATAGVLMFRALGIPARYVSGYTADLVENAVTNVPDSAAHAWVEIYVDGWGWYPVEVTPGFSDEFDLNQLTGLDPAPEGVPTLPPPETVPPAPAPTPYPSRDPDAAPPPEGPSGPAAGLPAALIWLAGLTAALAAAAAALWLLQFGLKRRRARRLAARDANRAVLDCYRWLSRMRPWGGEIPPGARALAEKAMYGGRPLTEEERRSAAALFNGQRERLWRRLYGWRRLTFLFLWGRPRPSDKTKPS